LPAEGLAALSPDGKRLAVVKDTWDKEPVCVWDLTTGKEQLRFQGVHVGGLTFSAGGLLAATGGAVQLWDVARGKQVARYEDEHDFFDAVAFSRDGRVVAASARSTVRLWELASGQQLASFTGHEDRVAALAFSPDGRCLASGSADSTIVLWDVTGRFREGGWPPSAPSARQLAALWQALGSARADQAYRAVWELAAAPAQAVPWIGERMPPAVAVSERQLEALVAGLDATRFAARQQAAHELAVLGPLAEPVLRRTLPRACSAEQRRRIEGLLAMLDDPARSPERLRELRAVAVLEYTATPEAQQMLRALAQGTPGAWRTREAKAALGRLENGPGGR
jgi:hypothetical protein